MADTDPGAAEQGRAVRREVLGEQHVATPPARSGPMARVWREFADAVSWGQVWARGGLDLRTRAICTVAVLCAQGDLAQLGTHIRGALRLGVSPAELAEVLIHVGSYAGAPKAAAAFAVADAIVAEPDRPG